MPVSKKRKPKRRNTAAIKSSVSSSTTAPAGKAGAKKKLSRQQIIIYVISFVMILSLAISYLVGNNSPTVVVPTPTAGAAQISTPAVTETEEAQPTPTTEPTEAN